MNIIKKTSLASGGTTEKRIPYLFVAMERELKDQDSVAEQNTWHTKKSSLVPRPRFPTAAGGLHHCYVETTRASQNIGTDVYIRNDDDVTLIIHASC